MFSLDDRRADSLVLGATLSVSLGLFTVALCHSVFVPTLYAMTDGMMLLVLPGRMTRIPLWIVAGAAASVAVLLLVLLFVGSYR